jgi:hypothetical protein
LFLFRRGGRSAAFVWIADAADHDCEAGFLPVSPARERRRGFGVHDGPRRQTCFVTKQESKMTKSTEALEMEMFAALGKHQRKHGDAANEALLKKFGATRAIDISPGDYERVIAACTAAADDDAAWNAPRTRNRLRFQGLGRDPTAFESVVNNAPDIKTGFDMAARAIHARPAKT